MPDALIGHTGFVGGTLLRQRRFDDCYNSKNIESIRSRRFDLIVCAGAPAVKWLANKEPEADLANLQRLKQNLAECRADRFLLISTVDVYGRPQGVDERTPISPESNHAYGRHRYLLERFVQETFPATCVVRLPGLFGEGLKKNFILDLLQGHHLDWTHCESVFQFYDMSRLWSDCRTVLEQGIPLVNLAVEPVRAGDVARQCFQLDFDNRTDGPPVTYDVRTRHGSAFGRPGDKYVASRDECLAAISDYVRRERRKAA